MVNRRFHELDLLLALILFALAVSGFSPVDQTTWMLEVFPIFIGLPVLVVTSKIFPLTPLVYRLIFLHMLVLIVGGHYTYAQVPLGFWMEDWFGFTRNHYDRIGHFLQGFVPALIAREILLRKTRLHRGKILTFLVLCVCLAISASYELLEWGCALALGQGADAFLGTQGDPWDTQEDMFLAFIGAGAALFLLTKKQDRQLKVL